MTGSLRSNHRNVNVFRRNDAAEVNVEAVREHQHIAFLKVRLNALLVQLCLKLIIDKNHNDVSLLRSLGSCVNLKACVLSLLPALGTLVKTYNNLHAAVLKVERMCVSLRTVTDNCNGLAVQQRQIAVLQMIQISHW